MLTGRPTTGPQAATSAHGSDGRGRLGSIDVLRAVAVLLVIGHHMQLPDSGPGVLRSALAVWQRGGWVGVDLFFVLSGFLVSGLLFREHQAHGRISPGSFLVRRGFKIYPAFWLLIAATFVDGLLHDHVVARGYLSELLFVQNYAYPLWPHTWSLAVEEHFYLLLLLLLVVLSKQGVPNPFRAIPRLFVVLAALLLGMRLISSQDLAFNGRTHLFPSHLRLDSLFCGVFLSYLYHYHEERFRGFVLEHRAALVCAGVLGFLPAFFVPLETSRWIATFGLTAFFVAGGLLVMGALAVDSAKSRLAAGLALMGTYSYSIYLWHIPVERWLASRLTDALGAAWGTYFLLYVGGSLVVGIALSLLVEWPMLRIRDRWFPSRARALAEISLAAGPAAGVRLGIPPSSHRSQDPLLLGFPETSRGREEEVR